MSLEPLPAVRRGELARMRRGALSVRLARRVQARRGPTRIRLWIPTTLLFGLLAPFALLALPFLYLAPRAVLPRPAAGIGGLGALLLSLSGTDIEVDTPDASVRVHLF